MTMLQRRELFVLIAALGGAALVSAPAHAMPGIDQEGAARIGEAYLQARPGLDRQHLQRELLPDGWSEVTLAGLRQRVATDFREGRMFIHRGWRLSDTEGRLFALAALSDA
ncbi:MAG: hypothetical protein EON93_14100 [Burkholderiales bacterium]|nr:MAG: hypothetical protein EON93_14100 [Burkholderiales bacterium]